MSETSVSASADIRRRNAFDWGPVDPVLREQYAKGTSASKIGKMLGIGHTMVIKRLRALEILVVPGSPWPSRDSELRELVDEKLSWSEIAERMGLSKNSCISRGSRIGLVTERTIMPGKVYGKRTVLALASPVKRKNIKWSTRCECGYVADVYACSLLSNKSLACHNCTRDQRIAQLRAANPSKRKARPNAVKAAKTDRPKSMPKNAGSRPVQAVRSSAPIVVMPIAPPPLPFVKRFRHESTDGCRFPFGNPGEVGFRFCAEATVDGKPYCRACIARCYVRQDVAA